MASFVLGNEVEQLATLTMHCLLRQRLQNARWLIQDAPNQTHSLLQQINAAIHTMWTNAGQLPDTVSKRHINAELTHVVRELDMRQAMFNLNTWSPDEEHFTGGMWNIILNSTLSTYTEPLPAILTPYVGWPIYEVTSMMASLGDTEGQWQAKSIRAVKPSMGNQASKGPTQVTRIQMWTALLAMGLNKNKIVDNLMLYS